MSSGSSTEKALIRAKIVLAGQPGVGKTSLTRRFVSNEFSEHHIETIGVRVEKRVVELENYDVELMVWDVAGDEDSAPFHDTYLRGATGVIYVADQTSPSSIDRISSLETKIQEVAPNHLQVAILNKSDLPAQSGAHEAFKGLAMTHKAHTSALTGEGVEDAFAAMAEFAVLQLK